MDPPSLERYLHQFHFQDSYSYRSISADTLAAEATLDAIDSQHRARFNRSLLQTSLEQFDPDDSTLVLPRSIGQLYARELKRIKAQLDSLADDYFRFSNDAFVKDLAILHLQLVPVGAEYAFPRGSVPRSLLFKGGISQAYRWVRSVLIQSGGTKPFLELHAHVLALEDFNPDGWTLTFRRLAELLEANPELRGITSSSWFLDPALESISPHLDYLRQVPLSGGATLLRSDWDFDGESGALTTSRTRRRLFEQGNYVPRVYTRVWPRRQLVAWNNRQTVPMPPS